MSNAAQKGPAEISVIIPALNEMSGLAAVIECARGAGEIVVVDGGSVDGTREESLRLGAKVISSMRGRARQMNAGAAAASGSIFLFLHADTWLQSGALENLAERMGDPSVIGGGFERQYRCRSRFLKTTCCLARVRNWGIGWHLGDQAIFCRAEAFRQIGGFREMRAFEDVDFSRRLSRRGRVITLTPAVLSSARRFEEGAFKRTIKDLALTAKYLVNPKSFLAGVMLIACFLSANAAERTAHVRFLRAPDLAGVSAVTLSPRGRIIAGQNDATSITIFDGYTSRQISLPENAHPRVYESRSGQFWCAFKEGLYLYQRGQWTPHYVSEIRQELARPRGSRPLSLVPAEVNRILFLVSDRLMEYNAGDERVSTLKLASETGIGQFLEMVETSDSSLLISGTGGVARVPGPVRHITGQTPWQAFPAPPNSTVQNFQRPAEIPNGSIAAIGFDSTRPEIRHLLTIGANAWQDEPFTGEKIRLTWPGWGNTRWGVSHMGLFRYTGQRPNPWVREGVTDTFYDAAANTNGAFWLATSSGLLRYAPLLWQSPPELAKVANESATAAMALGEDSIWLATADALVRVGEGKAERFPWPEEFESPPDSLFEIPDGRVLVGSAQRTLIFSPSSNRFEPIRITGAADTRAIGSFRDGSICLRIAIQNDAHLYRFNGRELEPFLTSASSNGIPADISVMLETRGGDIWLAGNFGVANYIPGEGRARLFRSKEGISPERIQALAEVGEDKIWAGGVDSIFELRGGHFERIKGDIERIHSMMRARDGAIWITAGDGVHRFENGAWITHGDEEGLPSTATHDIAQDRRGRIWVATNRGAVTYFPEADEEEPRTLPPVMYERDSEEGRFITVQFSGLDKWDYTAPTRLLFSYKLDEGSWTPFTNVHTVTFTNLSSGSHYVQSRAMDRNGNKASAIATLEFAITLPWFRDPRLLGVVILAAGAVLFLAGVAINRHLRLKRSYAEVELMVAERTAQLEKANQELLHSQKMRALGTLAAGIAHDFNNILSIIKGSAQIIEGNPEDKEKVLTRASRIQTVVEQGAGIVRSMLGLGKGSDQTECDPAELVDESVRLLADRFPEEIIIRHEKSGTIPKLTCSKGVIHQILLNLILNAVDAGNGKGTIILRTRVAEAPLAGLALQPAPADTYLAIDVIDEGIGIAAEALPRIFEPFFTTKSFSSRRGTGLGLSMVYELAKGMGYGLAVESTPNKGSVFTLLAPLG